MCIRDRDSNGHIAVVDDLFILILIGLFASLALILGWMTIPEIKESWSNYCTSLGNGLADIGNAVIDGGKAAWRYSRTQDVYKRQAEIHAIEHLGATFLRNESAWGDKVVYFGPMGCRTGFYLILAGDYDSADITGLMISMYEFIRCV